MERFIGGRRPRGMKTWAAVISVVALLGLTGCESDDPKQEQDARPQPTATPTIRTALDKEPAIVTVRGRLVHVGGFPPGTIGPIRTGTVRYRSSAGTFRDQVDSNGRFEMKVRAGRYYVEGALRNGKYVCGTHDGSPVSVTGREPAVTVYCHYR